MQRVGVSVLWLCSLQTKHDSCVRGVASGPMVWDEEPPMPIGKGSKTLCITAIAMHVDDQRLAKWVASAWCSRAVGPSDGCGGGAPPAELNCATTNSALGET